MKPVFAALILAIAVTAQAAPAQDLAVDFEIVEDDQAAGCGGSMVAGLVPGGDGFLAVRSGPGTGYDQIDGLVNGDLVRTCAMIGDWVGIYYGDPRRRGWVHGDWLVHTAG